MKWFLNSSWKTLSDENPTKVSHTDCLLPLPLQVVWELLTSWLLRWWRGSRTVNPWTFGAVESSSSSSCRDVCLSTAPKSDCSMPSAKANTRCWQNQCLFDLGSLKVISDVQWVKKVFVSHWSCKLFCCVFNQECKNLSFSRTKVLQSSSSY